MRLLQRAINALVRNGGRRRPPARRRTPRQELLEYIRRGLKTGR